MTRSLTYFTLIFCFFVASITARAACVSDTPYAGCIHFAMRTDSSFYDNYTHFPSQQTKDFMLSHFWRTQVSYGFFESNLSWYPNAWTYLNSYGITYGDSIVSQHPEYVLHDASGNPLYVGYACSGSSTALGHCSRYAGNIANEGWRQYTIAQHLAILQRGYKGVWLDDVNLDLDSVLANNNTSGTQVTPIDTNTGSGMSQAAWLGYWATFLGEYNSAIAGAGYEIQENSVWFEGGRPAGASTNQQAVITASNKWVNIERGVTDSGLGGGTGDWSLNAVLAYIDQVHAKGRYIDIQNFNFNQNGGNNDYVPACYFLISSGLDAMGNDAIIPSNWPANYDVDMGTALGARYTWNGLLRRDWSNGIVLVNPPGGAQQTYSLGGTYKDVQGNTVTSVNLASTSGAILFSTVPALQVTTSTLPGGTVGVAYSQALTASGGTSPYTWTIASGTLPNSTTLSSGAIGGTPSVAGTFSFTVQVTDNAGATATKAFSIVISAAANPLTFNTTTFPGGTTGSAYDQFLSASGGTAPYAWSILSGSIPTGISFAAGEFKGTPTVSGTYTFTVKLVDQAGTSITKSLSISIVSGTSLPIQQLQANGLEFGGATVVSVPFPSANTLHSGVVVLLRNSTASAPPTLTDTHGNPYTMAISTGRTTGSNELMLFCAANIAAGANTVTATYPSSNAHVWMTIYEYSGLDLTTPCDQAGAATGTSATPISAIVTTTYPQEVLFSGLWLASADTETVTASAGYTMQLQNTGSARGASETQWAPSPGSYESSYNLSSSATWVALLVTLKAAPPSVAVTTSSLPSGMLGSSYTQTLTAAGGTTPYSWVISSGTLPPGLTLSTSGLISGTPTAAGTYIFGVQVTDATSAAAIQSETLVIAGTGLYQSYIGGAAILGGNAILH